MTKPIRPQGLIPPVPGHALHCIANCNVPCGLLILQRNQNLWGCWRSSVGSLLSWINPTTYPNTEQL
ncbi:hypothetical protein N8517_02320 [Synechococcus sp. AH-601-L23]|nr:hypothetical protein [Synechococcus sp. AH-601-L23]